MSPFVRDRVLPFFGFLGGFLILAWIAMLVLAPHSKGGVGGPFKLTTPDGGTVTEKVLQGHPTLVFFGYTHCPDVCPTTLAQISAVFKELGQDQRAQALFVTVDPQRDTPVVMKDYMSSFDPRIIGLTGTPDEVRQIVKEYHVYVKPQPDKDGTYAVDHTAMTYLMDKNGAFVTGFNLDQPAKQAAAELEKYF